ncbi:hypothetical protein DM02DRAFT_666335 [Periconia macrospinosa]|uniref:Uncharacterized protein n=1 Tax=Periconia macrospinosa TaxID=97972 RepID=A0A2V1EC17_9PLEO|nr:hypothetical protein DM02DRAFT_666335 [Periconia macrospinosa]
MQDRSQHHITSSPEFPNSNMDDRMIAQLKMMSMDINDDRLPSIHTLLIPKVDSPCDASAPASVEAEQKFKAEEVDNHTEMMNTDRHSSRLPSVHTLLNPTAYNRLQQLTQHMTPCPTLTGYPTPSPSPIISQASPASISPTRRGRRGKQAKKSRTPKADVERDSREVFAELVGLLQRELCSDNPFISSEWTKLKSNNVHKTAKSSFTVKKNQIMRSGRYQLGDLKDAIKEEIHLAIQQGDYERAERLSHKLKHAGCRRPRQE